MGRRRRLTPPRLTLRWARGWPGAVASAPGLRATTVVPADYFADLLAALDEPEAAPQLAKAVKRSRRTARITARCPTHPCTRHQLVRERDVASILDTLNPQGWGVLRSAHNSQAASTAGPAVSWVTA